jgi:trehalose/maltose hydrolase-like predicted phosphorylase
MHHWKIKYDQYNPKEQALRESLCTLGNGYFASRGAAEECHASDTHYPGTYLGGGYNRLKSQIAGKVIENEDLVNWPNWLYLTFRPHDGEWFHIDQVEVLDFQQELHLKRGILIRKIHFRDQNNRETKLVSKRLVHMGNPHLAAIEWTLTPLNWSGEIKVHSAIDASVRNNGVKRYRALNNKHLNTLAKGQAEDDTIFVRVETNQSYIQMSQAARTRFYANENQIFPAHLLVEQDEYVGMEFTLNLKENASYKIEKIVSLYTSIDYAISESCHEAKKEVKRAPRFEDLVLSHIQAWNNLWYRCNISLSGDLQTQLLIRLHIFHLLQTACPNTADLDIGIPARGWHGEAYRGHIFWDELFIFPFYNLRIPELTRELLMYRYRRLPEARWAALEEGYKGAMFPWQSGSNGREETQKIHLNPKSGRWLPDDTHLQRHINIAIVYNIWQYYQVNNDIEFLLNHGAEMILDIARFLVSLTSFSAEKNRYVINGIVGPDEYHTHYPDSDTPGINNNAYTNIMTVWVLVIALESFSILAQYKKEELLTKLNISEEELRLWEEISKKMFVPFHGQNLISQFEGYEKLKEFPWKAYEAKFGDIHRLDRILESENDSVNNYKASKQADVLMLFYLLPFETLQMLFKRMGYHFTEESVHKNILYYEDRTSHGSTLSRLIHSWVWARSERARSWFSFERVLISDFHDIQGGTTPEGIHLGAMAGSVDMIQRCYSGLVINQNTLWITPALPNNLTSVAFRVKFRGVWIKIFITHHFVKVDIKKGIGNPVNIGIQKEVFTLDPGESKTCKTI